MEFIQAQMTPFLSRFRDHKVEAGLFGGSLATCLAGLVLLIISLNAPVQSKTLDYSKAPNGTNDPRRSERADNRQENSMSAGEIAADIAGAVNRPGVYYLPRSARLTDLLEKADGLSEQADHLYVSRTLNLAKTIADQEKVYIPSLGEEAAEFSSTPLPSARVQNSVNSLSEGPLLNINSATKDELEDLPGIGQITAEKIIKGRPYATIEELFKNGILKPTVFTDIKAKISI